MKSSKKLHAVGGFVFLVALGCMYANQKTTETNQLLIGNVEALAEEESDMEGRIYCYSSFVGKDSGSKTVKDCGDCMDVDCIDCSDRSKCKK